MHPAVDRVSALFECSDVSEKREKILKIRKYQIGKDKMSENRRKICNILGLETVI